MIDGDLGQELYGHLYPSLVDLSSFCDAAAVQADAGAWANVPYFLDLMRQAAIDLGNRAEFGRGPTKATWERCAAELVTERRNVCRPACDIRDYTAVLNDVANRCGGSDVYPGGGAKLVELRQESGDGEP